MEESNWSSAKGYSFSQNQMPGTPPQISGIWKMTYDNENVYVLAKMKDPTNEIGRIIQLDIENSNYTRFKAFRTDEFDENYEEIGVFESKNGNFEYLSPSHSVTTFMGIK